MHRLTTLLLSLLIIACAQNPKPEIEETTMKSINWQGHRGARGLVPENTIPSFLKAMEYQVNTLELDVAVSKDSVVIISHEPYMSSHICSGPDGNPITEEEEQNKRIYEMTYEEIKTYDCGSRGNERFPEQQPEKVYKPSLADMVAAVKAYCTENNVEMPYFNIELKSRPDWDNVLTPAPEDFAKIVLDEINELGIKEKTNIQSFDKRSLQAVRAIDPTVVTALLIENMDGVESNVNELGYTPEIYSPYYMVVTDSVVKKVHDMGMQLIPWTVNDTAVMQRMIDLGVDGIITDYPNKISEVAKK